MVTYVEDLEPKLIANNFPDGDIRFPEDKLPLINRTVDLGNNRTLKPWRDGEGGYQ